MNQRTSITLAALLLTLFTALHAAETTAVQPIDRETLDKWSAPYRGWQSYDIKAPRVLKKRDEKYWTLYGCYAKQGGYELDPGYEGVASSEDGMTWKRAKDKYILSPFTSQTSARGRRPLLLRPWQQRPRNRADHQQKTHEQIGTPSWDSHRLFAIFLAL